jgi:hypothetical protein
MASFLKISKYLVEGFKVIKIQRISGFILGQNQCKFTPYLAQTALTLEYLQTTLS